LQPFELIEPIEPFEPSIDTKAQSFLYKKKLLINGKYFQPFELIEPIEPFEPFLDTKAQRLKGTKFS